MSDTPLELARQRWLDSPEGSLAAADDINASLALSEAAASIRGWNECHVSDCELTSGSDGCGVDLHLSLTLRGRVLGLDSADSQRELIAALRTLCARWESEL